MDGPTGRLYEQVGPSRQPRRGASRAPPGARERDPRASAEHRSTSPVASVALLVLEDSTHAFGRFSARVGRTGCMDNMQLVGPTPAFESPKRVRPREGAGAEVLEGCLRPPPVRTPRSLGRAHPSTLERRDGRSRTPGLARPFERVSRGVPQSPQTSRTGPWSGTGAIVTRAPN
jgi:hypothetical protein